MSSPRIVVVDDHPVTLEGLASMVKSCGYEVVGQARTVTEAQQQILAHKPELVITDYRLGETLEDAPTLIRQVMGLTPAHSRPKFIVISMFEQRRFMDNAFQAGARAYLTKDSLLTEIQEAIETVLQGGYYLSKQLGQGDRGYPHILNLYSKNERLRPLSPREIDVWLELLRGSSREDVAKVLEISIKTFDQHRRNLFHKLQIDSDVFLVYKALEYGLITCEQMLSLASSPTSDAGA